MEFTLTPVAFVRGTRHAVVDDYWGGELATIELAANVPDDSLDGLDAFSHAEILFVFDKLDPPALTTGARHPRGNTSWPKVGIFAQRAKARPNRIGATIVKIVKREGRTLTVSGLDALDGTPVIDIKPVFREFLPSDPVVQPPWTHELMRDYWTRRPK
jgi:tRNA-Thr(GGU) m(6)t(6)A37 methyltransferase TsaA